MEVKADAVLSALAVPHLGRQSWLGRQCCEERNGSAMLFGGPQVDFGALS